AAAGAVDRASRAIHPRARASGGPGRPREQPVGHRPGARPARPLHAGRHRDAGRARRPDQEDRAARADRGGAGGGQTRARPDGRPRPAARAGAGVRAGHRPGARPRRTEGAGGPGRAGPAGRRGLPPPCGGAARRDRRRRRAGHTGQRPGAPGGGAGRAGQADRRGVAGGTGRAGAARVGAAGRPGAGRPARAGAGQRLVVGAPEAGAALAQLGSGPPAGRVPSARRAVSVASARSPIEELLARGLLGATGDESVTLPREVALHLRGGQVHRDLVALPPELEGTARDQVLADRTAAGKAFTFVRAVEELCERWSIDPPGMLRTGGLGVRDMKRTATEMDLPEWAAALVVEVAYAAGLIAAGGSVDGEWLPTSGYDLWRVRPTADRWVALAAAWLTMDRVPGL